MPDHEADDRRGLARAGVVVARDGAAEPRAHHLVTSMVDTATAFVVATMAVLATKACDGTLRAAAACSDGGGSVYAALVLGAWSIVAVGAVIAVVRPGAGRRIYRIAAVVSFAVAVAVGLS